MPVQIAVISGVSWCKGPPFYGHVLPLNMKKKIVASVAAPDEADKTMPETSKKGRSGVPVIVLMFS